MNIGKLIGRTAKTLLKAAKPIVVAAVTTALTNAAAKKLGKRR